VINPAEVGVFRQTQVVVRGLNRGEVVHRPPNAVEIPYQIEDFFLWLNSNLIRDYYPVIKAAIAHYELARIHPFTEGNGRASRAEALLILAIEGIDARRFFSIEEHFDKNIEEYYLAFDNVAKNGGDLTSWLEFFSRALAIEMNKIKERVKRLSIDLKLKDKMGGKQVALTERQIRLIEYLENAKDMTMIAAKEVLPMVSDDTILRDLKDLMKKGLVKKKGRTKGSVYALRK
jgi:Fic family protein